MKGDRFIYKIGYSSKENLNNRLNSYFYMSPGSEIISVREGDEILESLLHYYLRFLGLQYKKEGKLNEWFLGDELVRLIFHISRESLERKIWRNRNKIFDKSRVGITNKSTTDNTLFMYLYEKNKTDFLGECFSVNEKNKEVTKNRVLEVDVVFNKYLIKTGKIEVPSINASSWTEKIVSDFLDNHFYKTGIFEKKMRLYCEFMDQYSGDHNQELQDLIYFKIKDDRFRKYYNFFGTKGCSAMKFREDGLYQGLLNVSKSFEVGLSVQYKFQVGESYTLKVIKEEISNIYRDLGVTKAPKATDIKEYFEVDRVKFSDPITKKRIEGFRIREKKLIV